MHAWCGQGNVTRFAGPGPDQRRGRAGPAATWRARRPAASTSAAPANAAASSGLMPGRKASSSAGRCGGQRQAGGEADGGQPPALADHEAHDRAGGGAERQPDADFARPLGDAASEHAVEAEQREEQRDRAEGADQRGGDLLRQERCAGAGRNVSSARIGSAGSTARIASRSAGASAAGSPIGAHVQLGCRSVVLRERQHHDRRRWTSLRLEYLVLATTPTTRIAGAVVGPAEMRSASGSRPGQ